MENVKNELLSKAIDRGTVTTPDLYKHLDGFFGHDNKEHILFLELVSQSNLEQAEVLELLMLKAIDKIKEVMLMPDSHVYSKQDLSNADAILVFIKLHIAEQRNEVEDLAPHHGSGMGVVNI